MFRNIYLAMLRQRDKFPVRTCVAGVTVQRHGESTGTKFAVKGSWGHPAAVTLEGKKQETGEEVKGSQSKTPNLDKLGLIQHEVYWQKLNPTEISQ